MRQAQPYTRDKNRRHPLASEGFASLKSVRVPIFALFGHIAPKKTVVSTDISRHSGESVPQGLKGLLANHGISLPEAEAAVYSWRQFAASPVHHRGSEEGPKSMNNWEKIISQGVKDVRDLQEVLHLPDEEACALCGIQEEFPMLVNSYYLSLMNPDDPDDPIRRMSIPDTSEADAGGSLDTSGEHSNTVMAGLQHKYRETALIISTNRCASYCRHCFRRRMVGLDGEEVLRDLDGAAAYIREHEEISNVLISGGDAFMNSNSTIRRYLSALCCIPHLDLIRFATRTPVVLPQRITGDSELLTILKEYSSKKKIYVVTQFNHPREITEESIEAIDLILGLGIPVRNQTVLLKGVNDDADVLAALLKGLTSIGVVPYYVFQCRPVTGVVNRFQVPLLEGYRIVERAKNMQNGQGKCFRYIASHSTGKIEILGPAADGEMVFKYHQAKDEADRGRIFFQAISEEQCWL